MIRLYGLIQSRRWPCSRQNASGSFHRPAVQIAIGRFVHPCPAGGVLGHRIGFFFTHDMSCPSAAPIRPCAKARLRSVTGAWNQSQQRLETELSDLSHKIPSPSTLAPAVRTVTNNLLANTRSLIERNGGNRGSPVESWYDLFWLRSVRPRGAAPVYDPSQVQRLMVNPAARGGDTSMRAAGQDLPSIHGA